MVDIGIMWMPMSQPFVRVRTRVRLLTVPRKVVRMLVMLVMNAWCSVRCDHAPPAMSAARAGTYA